MELESMGLPKDDEITQQTPVKDPEKSGNRADDGRKVEDRVPGARPRTPRFQLVFRDLPADEPVTGGLAGNKERNHRQDGRQRPRSRIAHGRVKEVSGVEPMAEVLACD